MTTTSIDILLPAGTVSYVIGSGDVININVHFYFANVVFVKVFFASGEVLSYYQVPCILHQIP